MRRRLLAIVERLRSRPRRPTLLLVALAVLGLVLAVVTPSPRPRVKAPTARASVRSVGLRAESRSVPTRPSPALSAQLMAARHAAEVFLAEYLRVAYGRPARVLTDAAPALRRESTGQRADATPAERRRHPRVVSLEVVGNGPGAASATAMVADGGIAIYALRLTLTESDGRWQVSGVETG